MITSFYDYAGLVGLISVITWIAAWVVTAIYAGAKKLRLANVSRVALVLALTAFFSAKMASHVISEIEVARTPPPEDPERAKTLETMKNRAANVRFAEDSATDRLDIGGASSHELQVAGVATTQSADWRSALVKQKRDAGMSKSASPTEATATQPAESGEAPVKPPRTLPEAEVLRANRLDDINLFITRLTLIVAIVLVLIDYLRRFNQTFTRVLPLPIASPLLDEFFPKSHLIAVARKPGQTGPGAIKAFLEKALLKRENFLYMGASDPWSNQDTLPRLLVQQKTIRIDKLICDESVSNTFRGFALEAVWHGQACVVCPSEASSLTMLEFAASVLGDKNLNIEPALRTVNVVWDFEAAPPDELLQQLARACPASNFRLFVVSAAPAQPKLFTETYSAAQIAV